MVGAMAVSEAPLEQTEHGLVCTGPGWFVANAEEVRWRTWEGLGFEERALRQWDFVHCPSGTAHVIVGGPCVVLGVGSREHDTDDWGEYVADPVAVWLAAAPKETTADFDTAYARFPQRGFTRYGGWLA
jgi:hypothetical protein